MTALFNEIKQLLVNLSVVCSWSRRALVIVRSEKGGGIVCNVYGLSYRVA